MSALDCIRALKLFSPPNAESLMQYRFSAFYFRVLSQVNKYSNMLLFASVCQADIIRNIEGCI